MTSHIHSVILKRNIETRVIVPTEAMLLSITEDHGEFYAHYLVPDDSREVSERIITSLNNCIGDSDVYICTVHCPVRHRTYHFFERYAG